MDSTRPIRALLRGLEALTVLNLRDGATVSEIAHEIHLPRTTVYRILETLAESGFVFRDTTDERYRLTIRVRGLSAGFDDEAWVTQIAAPELKALADEIAWPLHLATVAGTKLIIRDATDRGNALVVERYSPGLQLPLLSTSAGRVFLAFCAAAQRDALIDLAARSNRDEDKAARHRGELAKALQEIRAQGYATSTRTRRLIDELSLSVPLALGERATAALTVRFIAAALPLKSGIERFLPKLRQCAARISSTYLEQHAEAPRTGASETAV